MLCYGNRDHIRTTALERSVMNYLQNYKCSQNVNRWQESVKPIYFINLHAFHISYSSDAIGNYG